MTLIPTKQLNLLEHFLDSGNQPAPSGVNPNESESVMKTINLWIYQEDTNVFMGESSELCINTNVPELKGTPIEFWANSYDDVLAQVKTYAKAKFGSGVIKLH